jgi:hypothetical protein
LQQQAQLPEKTRIKGLFALGDVYDAVSKRVLANTYASLRELNWVQSEAASFHPVYPDGSRNVIDERAFDAIYLFGNNNESDIEFSSPDDFSQLCADFIFLDSGADAQEEGDSLSAMLQSTRNNAEVYTMNYDADGTPHSYSALGLCKIRFPADRVAELCAVRMGQEIIDYHMLGRLNQAEILEAKQKAQEFLNNEGFSFREDNTDLPDRITEKTQENGEKISFNDWVTRNLVLAHNNDLENITKLEIGKLNQIVQILNQEVSRFQGENQARVVDELQTFQRIVEQTVKKLFQENLGVSFVAKFLEELLERMRSSRDFAQQRMQIYTDNDRQYADHMNNQIKEMADLLGSMLGFLKREAQRAQLKETYRAIRQYFMNRIDILKARAAIDFYEGVFDNKQKLVEGGEGALSILASKSSNIGLIQVFVTNQKKDFQAAYENYRKIKGSPFEILIYDNDSFTTLEEVYISVYSDALRTKLFESIIDKMGGSIWNIRTFMNEAKSVELRNIILAICTAPFEEAIDKKTVSQRIIEARQNKQNPIDYGQRLQNAYQLADYFCRLNDTATRFAGLRNSEQAIDCIIAYQDEQDFSWGEVKKLLRQAIARVGKQTPFAHTSDRHSILLYREFCGFPAYTLRRITAYHNSYLDEAKRENNAPLQMLTREPLVHINVPNSEVLSKFTVMIIEAINFGIVIHDEENYFMVTQEEWGRRKLAEEAQAKGDNPPLEDRTAGSARRMGATLNEAISRLNERLPESARLYGDEVMWDHQISKQIEERRSHIDRDTISKLLQALYFEGIAGTKFEKINLETDIRPAIVYLLNRDFALRQEHFRRPPYSHQQLLRNLYIGA